MKLAQTLSRQNIKVTHLILWDQKREPGGVEPHDSRITDITNENYKAYHYVIRHPIKLEKSGRIDNHMRMMGLSMTTTDFFTFIDDDCWLEEGWCQTAIGKIQRDKLDYCYCQRYLWDSQNHKLGIDDYESIGEKNKFGYHLIDMNTIVYSKNLQLLIYVILSNHNHYEIDRKIAETLLRKYQGVRLTQGFLNQISPDFLLAFHKQNIFSNTNTSS